MDHCTYSDTSVTFYSQHSQSSQKAILQKQGTWHYALINQGCLINNVSLLL